MPQLRQPVAGALAAALVLGAGWSGAADAAAGRRRRAPPRPTAARSAAGPAAAPAPRVAGALLAAARPAAGAASMGRVEFVTDKRAYLDRGSDDGLTAGQAVQLARAGRNVGACTVDSISHRGATCVGGRPRVGDSFRLPRARPRPARARVPILAAVVDEETLRTRATLVADGTIDKVDFTGKRVFRDHTAVEVTPGFAVWFTPADGRGGYAQQRIDGAIRGVNLGATGFRFDGAFSAIRWTAPAAGTRFRPDTPTQFYLWEAEASRRSEEGGTTVAIGRLWPYHTPGLTLLDGVQLGRRSQDHTVEAGAYGGLIPTAASIAPAFDTWTAGLYGALLQPGDRRSLLRLHREEARVGVWRGTLAGVVTEGEALAEAWVGPVTLGGGGRARWAARDGGSPALEQAHLDLGVRPSLEAAGGLHLRYLGTRLLPDAPLRAELPALAGVLHAVADARLELSPRIGLAAHAAAHRESATGRRQVLGGAEARFPRLLAGTGGIWLGAEVQRGWMQGEMVYLQLVGHRDARVQLVARLSVDGTRFETPTTIWNLHEVGAYLDVDGTLTPWLRVHAWSLLRSAFWLQGEPASYPTFGGVAGISLAGAI